ncbi:pyridoxamine 5'-phosphate oxidase family protein [Pediococcus stilesii]|uniref:Pyridoxamine 5'-phosphate oxidase family protein n=1 Tax=Pediococcus stilesii TaxID=331679 RepID=A0A0R2L5U2_9LACO|nr:pyridoxamine 5'-phosphate oxidase family protein [Pediococcus stilesii]KRN95285.1 hypothetical protein IV81_GL000169 [Pediococcus stilesii]TLQ04647.1 pyridoxamine 5'-phosphate oxidase family protein [Pediococcus stilesii]
MNNTLDILTKLKETMTPAAMASVDADGKPHVRHINIGMVSEHGIYFVTSPKTDFYKQLMDHPYVSIEGLSSENVYEIVRVEGQVEELGQDQIEDVVKDNKFITTVYQNPKDRENARVFRLFEGSGLYHNFGTKEKVSFEIK